MQSFGPSTALTAGTCRVPVSKAWSGYWQILSITFGMECLSFAEYLLCGNYSASPGSSEAVGGNFCLRTKNKQTQNNICCRQWGLNPVYKPPNPQSSAFLHNTNFLSSLPHTTFRGSRKCAVMISFVLVLFFFMCSSSWNACPVR